MARNFDQQVKLRMDVLKNGSKSLYLDIYHKGSGRRERRRLGLYLTGDKKADRDAKRLAEIERAKVEAALMAGRFSHLTGARLEEPVPPFLETVGTESEKFQYKTIKGHLERFSADRGIRSLCFKHIDPEFAEEFRAYLDERVHRNTTLIYFTLFKYALKVAVRKKIIPVNPADGLPALRSKPTKRVALDIDEVRRLAKTPCPSELIRRAFLFTCFTGTSMKDIRALKWSNIEYPIRLTYRRSKTSNIVRVPLTEEMSALLGNPGEEHELVFPDIPHLSTVNNILKKWTERAGITKHITYHCGRHTFATLNIGAGNNVYTVKEMLGHSSIVTTEIYAKMVDKELVASIERMPRLSTDTDE